MIKTPQMMPHGGVGAGADVEEEVTRENVLSVAGLLGTLEQ